LVFILGESVLLVCHNLVWLPAIAAIIAASWLAGRLPHKQVCAGLKEKYKKKYKRGTTVCRSPGWLCRNVR
jgi:hypothetical protein